MIIHDYMCNGGRGGKLGLFKRVKIEKPLWIELRA